MELLLCVVLCASCNSKGPSVTAFDGLVRFQLLDDAAATEDLGKHAWRLHELPLVVTAQRIPRHRASGPRTLGSVASGLSHRYELGEVAGEISARHDRLGAREILVTRGAIVDSRSRKRYRRSAILFSHQDYIYQVEIVAEDGVEEHLLDEQMQLLRSSLDVG